ncbi:MAG: hypothetical protein QGF09_08715, partial [Rhodospirillales bacterium]|nr:hypothetical protein [Rhodospirillales bacterium]
GFGQTKATHGEVLTEFSLAPLAPGSASIYLKYHDRQSMDMTVAGIGAYVEPDPAKEVIKDIRLALAGAAPIVVRAKPAEDILRGKPPSDENLMAAAEAACDQASPRSNSWRASPGYRLDLIRNLTQRAIKAAWDKAAGGEKATS